MEFAVAADHVFDGTMLRHDCAVVIEDRRIRAVMRRNDVPKSIRCHTLPREAWLAPGFIDTQVNGGGDVLFNDDPTPHGIAAIAAAHRRFGTTALLPTLLSDTPAKMRISRHAVETVAGIDPSVIGLHYEGPFLSPDKAGVHDQGMLRHPGPAMPSCWRRCAMALRSSPWRPSRCRRASSRSWRAPRFGYRSAIRWRPTHKPGRRYLRV